MLSEWTNDWLYHAYAHSSGIPSPSRVGTEPRRTLLSTAHSIQSIGHAPKSLQLVPLARAAKPPGDQLGLPHFISI